ncbi:MAG: XRE family transcriptional regulator [Rhodospirillales bacterium]|nr:XRE family transcriptional regulator [Rhodospirillales bacterium]
MEARVTPSVMKWARESAKLDVATAAKKIGRSEDEIEQWERGDAMPSFAQARKASEVYKRSLAVFYLPEPPTEFDTLRDFRQLPQGASREWSPELALLIRQVQARQEWLREYSIEEGIDPVPFIGSATLQTPVADLAKSIRDGLELPLEEQMACNSPREALNLWIDHAEYVGILICRQGGIECEEARGFVLTDEYAPFIYINSNDSYAGRLFTLVHELVHLWINQPGISNLGNLRRLRSEEARIERFCNQVAADTLVDQSMMAGYWSQRDQSEDLRDQVSGVAKRFAVSEEVIARRLLDMNEIAEADYLGLRRFYNERWAEHRRRQRSQDGFVPHGLRMALANGYQFSRTVIGAYKQGRISGRDVSTLLHVKVNNIPALTERVYPSTRSSQGGGR